MTQTLAIFKDAYRELNSKRLFWVTLAISAIVVLTYGSIGFDDNGMSMFFGLTHIESPFIKTGSPWAKALYLGIFSDFIVGLWLAWIATVLALISTTSVFPDLLAGGSIDMVLSKPIGRLRLFLVKYLASLMFVLLQVALFCFGIFLCVGLRLGEWKWMIFAAIPLVTVFFSYLYSVNVLVGVFTRSALTALLLTMLFWFGLWSVQSSEALLNRFRTQFEIEKEMAQKQIDRAKEQAAVTAIASQPGTSQPAATRPRSFGQVDLAEAERRFNEADDFLRKISRWHTPVDLSLAVLPKTGQTIGLLGRWFVGDSKYSIFSMLQGDMENAGVDNDLADVPEFEGRRGGRSQAMEREINRRLDAKYSSKTEWYVIGTSLMFEVGVLALAAFIFCRRDF